jgi:hypothetical protein
VDKFVDEKVDIPPSGENGRGRTMAKDSSDSAGTLVIDT